MEESRVFPYWLFFEAKPVSVELLHEIALFYKDLFFDRLHLRRRVHQSEIISQETILQRFSIDVDYNCITKWGFKFWEPRTFFVPILWHQKRIPLMTVDCFNEDNSAMNIARSTEYRATMSFALLGVVISQRMRSWREFVPSNSGEDVAWEKRFLEATFSLLSTDCRDNAELPKILEKRIMTEVEQHLGQRATQFKEIMKYIWGTYTLCVVVNAQYLERRIGLIKLETPIPINLEHRSIWARVGSFFRYIFDPAKRFVIELPEFGEHHSACHARFRAPEGTEIVNVRLCPVSEQDANTIGLDDKLEVVSSNSELGVKSGENNREVSKSNWKLLQIQRTREGIESENTQTAKIDDSGKGNIAEKPVSEPKRLALILFDASNVEIQDLDLVSLPISSWKAEISIVPELRHFHYPALYVLCALTVLFTLRSKVPVNEVLVSGLTAGIAFLANSQKHYHLSRIIQEERFALVLIIAASVPLSFLLDMDRPLGLYIFLDWVTGGMASTITPAEFSLLFAGFYFVIAVLFFLRLLHYQRYGLSRYESAMCVN